MFSLSIQGSFTPYCFGHMFLSPSFYCYQQPTKIDPQETRIIFSPILIASLAPQEDQMIKEISLKTKQINKENLNEKFETQDEDYTPSTKIEKKQKKNQQNENRNIMPNIVNQIFSYIQKKNKSMRTTKKIFQKLNGNNQWSVKRFYLYQNMIKNKISNYVNEETMKIYKKTGNVDQLVYSVQQQQFYNKVSRILVFHFLHTEGQTSTLTSRRMDKTKKALHINVQTQLTQKLKQIYKFQ